MPKFKITLQKELLQEGEVMVLLTGDTSCHIQGLHSTVYALFSIQHGKVSFLLKVNIDRHLDRDNKEILVPGHSEGDVWILKSLDI